MNLDQILEKLMGTLQRAMATASQMQQFNECARCGDCCRGVISISGAEAALLNGRAVVNQGVGCPFLNSDNKCTVYRVRPVVCRVYGPTRANYRSVGIHQHMIMLNVSQCENGAVSPMHQDVPEELMHDMIALFNMSGSALLSSGKTNDAKKQPYFAKLLDTSNGIARVIASPDFNPRAVVEMLPELDKLSPDQIPMMR